jgi:hypothetical protein
MCDMCNDLGWYRFDGEEHTCPFCKGEHCVRVGKYKGVPYSEVPEWYVNWVRNLEVFADKRFHKWTKTTR